MKRFLLLAAILAAPVLAQAAITENTVNVVGQAMYPSKTIVGNAVNSADHTTLVAAVKAAGLADTLNGKGPFTVFAPTNEAFGDLPADTVPTLLKPENKPMLTKVLTYHVVAGDYTTTKLRSMILAGNGMRRCTTATRASRRDSPQSCGPAGGPVGQRLGRRPATRPCERRRLPAGRPRLRCGSCWKFAPWRQALRHPAEPWRPLSSGASFASG